MRILIVDDSKTSRLHMRIPLEKAGFTVFEAGTGDEGLNFILSQQQPLDLIISDQNMPVKTGIQMITELRALKNNPSANCAVVFLTSDSSPIVRDKCKDLGARAIVMKPIKPEVLADAVRKLLGVT